MEHDAVQTTRRKIGKVTGAVAVTLAAMACTAGPAWAGATTPSAQPPAGKEPGSPTPAPGEQLMISTYDGNVYTIDPSDTDVCQDQPAGLASWAANSPITMTPDGTVWSSTWAESSQLAKVGTYSPASVNWADNSQTAGGPAALHDVAGLLAENASVGVATGYYSGTLMKVNFKTGTFTDIGSLPAGPGDGLTWAPNGDLLMASYADNHIWRLPAAVLQSAINGNKVAASNWLDLGGISASDWSDSRWYDPFSWGGGSTEWWNPFTWSSNAENDHIYGLTMGSDGTLYIVMKYGKLFTLASNNLPTTADSTRALQVEGLRNLMGGDCSISGRGISGMTSTNQWLFAPAATDSTAQTVSAVAGQPITGSISSSMVKPPVSVLANASTLPAGVTVGPDGTLSGTPVAAGTSTAQVKVCGLDTCVWKNVAITVTSGNGNNATGTQKPPPADPTMTLDGSANAPVSGTLPGSAAAAPSTFTVTDPTQLPPGVSIDASGNLMGIPAAAGTYPIPVKACNATGCTTGTVTLTIGPDQTPCDQNPASTVAYVTAHTHVDM
jgi:hypothetical protein